MNNKLLNWNNDKMIKVYRIAFVIQLMIFLSSIAFGLIMIALCLGVITILTFILLLFEIQEDYFNKKIESIIGQKKESG